MSLHVFPAIFPHGLVFIEKTGTVCVLGEGGGGERSEGSKVDIPENLFLHLNFYGRSFKLHVH